ncbi:MAG TPA: hypothetical protein VJ673_10400 [Aromatoleum sp.]|uniref:hypothetical protein n=1 Tax=Aromatoleum sp. TaxID=2307007 RepID=UPI002B47687E|nr:hypothetical protein [Aromatoleum sp.]HJV26093.1 hypothetical protein [Aromatoleum sp.]
MTVRQAEEPVVRHFNQILLWPLRLLPVADASGVQQRPWWLLQEAGARRAWRESERERDHFNERHYHEFVTFLPYVQRFLYGDGVSAKSAEGGYEDSPMRIFERRDIVRARVAVRETDDPVTLDVTQVRLHFFFDVDVVLLKVAVRAENLPLSVAQELMYRFGRAYPSGWEEDGRPLHSLAVFDWLAADGSVLASTDVRDREAFLAHVRRHRAPRIAAHWAFLLEPLVSDRSEDEGALRYRQIEYYRMPLMAYLALDDPTVLTRNDFIRLGLVTGARPEVAELATGDSCEPPPFAETHLADFEERFCYDRFWSGSGAAPHTRYLCSGHSLVVVGDARSAYFTSRDFGVPAQFGHQHFLLFLIAHFQKAALLMFSDRLVEALKRLNVSDPVSVRSFKRAIRGSFEGFLRFTHRYWFHEIAEQAQARTLFRMTASHLEIDPLYAEVKDRIADMDDYLAADSLRRQANTVVRLTVVTVFGLIGSITTGFLGMNLLAEADAPLRQRLTMFVLVAVATSALTLYTMSKSKRLSDFLDALSDERLTVWTKVKAFAGVWQRGA